MRMHCSESRHSLMHHSSPVGYLDVCLIQMVEAVDGNGVGKGGSTVSTYSNPARLWYRHSSPNVMSPSLENQVVCSLPLTRQYERVSPFSMK